MSTNTYFWDTGFLSSSQEPPAPLALIVLNQNFEKATFLRLWLKCQWRIFADGGSNRVYDTFNEEERLRYQPDHIKGDFDSIRPNVRLWYEQQGVTVEEDHDQDSTDLMKCLRWVDQIEERQNIRLDVVILGGLSGRLDHTVHTMSLLHKLRTTRPRIFVVSGESIGWVLDKVSERPCMLLVEPWITCTLAYRGITASNLISGSLGLHAGCFLLELHPVC
ncbi:hypothetical protein FRC12_010560 [Ceratobasidium sp. 428]|nr:hypothetical protein FRC12_010560 [Ceratobasidium sp. 428]